jgi:hypothetical protein
VKVDLDHGGQGAFTRIHMLVTAPHPDLLPASGEKENT